MKQAKYGRKIVAAIEIYNEYGVEIPAVIDEFKIASSKHLFQCIDTGLEVVFCYGKKNIPHFRYIKGTRLIGNAVSGYESRSHEAGIELLYKYLKKFNLGYDIYMDKKLDFERRANILIDIKPIPIVIEYVVSIGKYASWKEKCDEYLRNGIRAIWIIDYEATEKNLTLESGFDDIKYQLGKYNKNNRIYILDRSNQKIHVEKYIEFEIDSLIFKREIFFRQYELNQLQFNLEDGFVLGDFDKDYFEECEKFFTKFKFEYEKQKIEQIKATKTNELTRKLSDRLVFQADGCPYNEERYKLLLQKFKKTELLSKEIYELRLYMKENISLFKKSFPQNSDAVKKIYEHESKLFNRSEREVFIDFENYVLELDY